MIFQTARTVKPTFDGQKVAEHCSLRQALDQIQCCDVRCPRAAATICLIVVRVPPGLATCLSIFIAIFAAEGTMIPLPFHFPLPVFELPHRHPSFIGRELLAPNTRSPHRMTQAP